jgi:hypothetical protein
MGKEKGRLRGDLLLAAWLGLRRRKVKNVNEIAKLCGGQRYESPVSITDAVASDPASVARLVSPHVMRIPTAPWCGDFNKIPRLGLNSKRLQGSRLRWRRCSGRYETGTDQQQRRKAHCEIPPLQNL